MLLNVNHVIGFSPFSPELKASASIIDLGRRTAILDIDFVKLGTDDFFIIHDVVLPTFFGDVDQFILDEVRMKNTFQSVFLIEIYPIHDDGRGVSNQLPDKSAAEIP